MRMSYAPPAGQVAVGVGVTVEVLVTAGVLVTVAVLVRVTVGVDEGVGWHAGIVKVSSKLLNRLLVLHVNCVTRAKLLPSTPTVAVVPVFSNVVKCMSNLVCPSYSLISKF